MKVKMFGNIMDEGWEEWEQKINRWLKKEGLKVVSIIRVGSDEGNGIAVFYEG